MTGRGRNSKSGVMNVYSGRDEFTDDCLSQDEDSGQNPDARNVVSYMPCTSKQRPSQKAKSSTSKSKGNKTSNKSGHSTASDPSYRGAGQSSHADKDVMTDNFNVEDKVFTRAFLIQIFIIIGLCTLWSLMFTMYSNHTQEKYLKENLDSIVTETGQKMVDKTIIDIVKARIEEIVDNHRVHVGKFNTDADSKIHDLRNFIDQMDIYIAEKKSEFGILNLDSLLSRQDRQATLMWYLSIIVIVMLVCVYWLCFMRNGKSGNTLERTNMVRPELAKDGPPNHPEVINKT